MCLEGLQQAAQGCAGVRRLASGPCLWPTAPPLARPGPLPGTELTFDYNFERYGDKVRPSCAAWSTSFNNASCFC